MLVLISLIPRNIAYLRMFFWDSVSVEILNLNYCIQVVYVATSGTFWKELLLNRWKRLRKKTKWDKKWKKTKSKSIITKVPTSIWIEYDLYCNHGVTTDIIRSKENWPDVIVSINIIEVFTALTFLCKHSLSVNQDVATEGNYWTVRKPWC